jgi:hypothetical protein
LIPGDTRITLVWDNSAELYEDPYYDVVHYADPASPLYDPYYIERDFQGYRVWRSPSGQAGTWELLTYCDLADGITFDDPTFEDTLRAEDTGIFHSFVDSDVRNGFAYYYAVSAFDWNEVKTIEGPDTFPTPIWFESGRTGDSTQARREAANYVAGDYMISAVTGNDTLVNNLEAMIVLPLEMTTENLYFEFGPYEYDEGSPHFSGAFLNSLDSVLGSVEVTLASGQIVENDFIPHNGLLVNAIFERPEISGTEVIFDSIRASNNYVFDSVIVSIDTTVTPPETTWQARYVEEVIGPRQMNTDYGNWAYRGNDYEVHWMPKETGGEVNTVVVIDAMTGDTIPYAPFLENAATDSLAACWMFRGGPTPVTDTLEFDMPGPPPLGTRYLNICGGKVDLKLGVPLVAGDPRPGDGDVWTVYARRDIVPAPVDARLEIEPTVALLDSAQLELNVKVVPNPYMIGNEWQTQFIARRVKFINLPNECTIRIFNLNGELVRTLEHRETSGDAVSNDLGGDEWWDVLSENRQLVASGVYIFHIRSDVGEQVGKFVIIQ